MPSTALKHFNGLKGNFKMESHVLLQTLESVSLTRKSRSKTIALFFVLFPINWTAPSPTCTEVRGCVPLRYEGPGAWQPSRLMKSPPKQEAFLITLTPFYIFLIQLCRLQLALLTRWCLQKYFWPRGSLGSGITQRGAGEALHLLVCRDTTTNRPELWSLWAWDLCWLPLP